MLCRPCLFPNRGRKGIESLVTGSSSKGKLYQRKRQSYKWPSCDWLEIKSSCSFLTCCVLQNSSYLTRKYSTHASGGKRFSYFKTRKKQCCFFLKQTGLDVIGRVGRQTVGVHLALHVVSEIDREGQQHRAASPVNI